MNKFPTISIVTPVYNGLPQIRRTLDSLARQTVPFEHLVMDSCSPDGTAAAVREYAGRYNVRVDSEKDNGHFDAVSKGFPRTQGEVMAWLNAGDIYMPSTLKVVSEVFAMHPEVDWITGIPGYFFEEREAAFVDPLAPYYYQTAIRRGWHNGRWLPFLQQESMFWRRSLWERAGGEKLLREQGGKGKGIAGDYLLWRQFAQYSRPRTVSSALAAFAHAEGQISEKFRAQYFKECGVDRVYTRCVRPTFYLWLLSSLVRIRATIKGHQLT